MMIGIGLLWVAIILRLIWLVRDRTDHRQRPSEETALTILDRRFAEVPSRLTTMRMGGR